MDRRVIWIIAIVALIVVGTIAGFAAMLLSVVFRMMDSSDAHVCGLAAVKSSPAAARLVGTPIEQKGLTGGSSSTDNGELTERITFNVRGPLGEAFVVSEGFRSPLKSHLTVQIGRDQHGETVYDGPFDCPQLHEARH